MKHSLLLIGFLAGFSIIAMGYDISSDNDDFSRGGGNDIPGWTLNPGIVPSGTAQVKDGVLVVSTDPGQKVHAYVTKTFQALPGEKIKLSIRARGRGAFALGIYLYEPGPKFQAERFGRTEEASDNWRRYETEFVVPEGQPLAACPVLNVTSGAQLEFDDFKGAIEAPVPLGWLPEVPGENTDPEPGEDGIMPYEMWTRLEDIPPLVDFTDCTKFMVVNHGTDARLYRSSEQRLFRETVGKVVFRALEPKAWFDVRLVRPLPVPEEANCVNFWNYGCSWCWVAEPHLFSSILLLDGDNREIELELEHMYYTYWHIQHKKLPETLKRPLSFVGFRFKGKDFGDIQREAKTIYLDSVTFYRQSEAPLDLDDLPKDLPFPTTPDTILPTPGGESRTIASVEGDILTLASSSGMDVFFNPKARFLDELVLLIENRKFTPFDGAQLINASGAEIPMELLSADTDGDRLRVNYRLPNGNEFGISMTLRWKSLVVDFQEQGENGDVEELRLGHIAGLKAPEARIIPMISYGWGFQPPQLVQDGNLFFFGHFDWYRSNGSELFATDDVANGQADTMGGVRYYPNTAGKRNVIHERLVFTASTIVEEVFPNIPNPPSPMRDKMAHRAWRIKPGVDYEAEVKEAREMRARGLSDVAIRYHESTWRDGGESYTFRTMAAPAKGGNAALRKLVKDIQDLGWLAGVYTGYNDLAPVNSHWDEDALAHDRNDNWITGWARCYQPKPLFSWKMAHKLAPEIGRIFGNLHVYCDVHTAVAPWIRTDFDHRAPGAACFRKTFEAFGLLLHEQRNAYSGPVYSEGGCHWFYAGLLDGNYSQIFVPQPSRLDWFPDFNLLKIHPLSIDAGMGSPAMFFRGAPSNYTQFIATTLVYGNIAILDGTQEEMERMYYLLTPIQKYYVMEPVETILWHDEDNTPWDTSRALVSGVHRQSRIDIRYKNGFTVHANGNPEPWTIDGHTLPQWGWIACAPDGTLLSAHETINGHDVEWTRGENAIYWNSPDGWTDAGWMAGKGLVILKQEADGWHLHSGKPGEDFSLPQEIPAIIPSSSNGGPDPR